MPETDTTQEEGLYRRLLTAQIAAKAVEKRGENKAQGYKYARAEDVIREAQEALHGAGLVGYMIAGERTAREITSQGGTAGLFVTLETLLIIRDPESGDAMNIGAIGTGVDYPGDKAIYKALTGAAKYAYASALGIPFGDDPEEETGTAGQERRPAAEDPASGPQKGTITRILNSAGLSREFQIALVAAFAGSPLTKSGASKVLDRIAPVKDDPEALRSAVDAIVREAEVMPPSDVPADTEGLPEPGDDDGGTELTLEERAEPA